MSSTCDNTLMADLEAFVLAVAAHLDSPPSPTKTAEYYQLRAVVIALRARITSKDAPR